MAQSAPAATCAAAGGTRNTTPAGTTGQGPSDSSHRADTVHNERPSAGVGDGGGGLEALLARLGPFGFYQRYVLLLLLLPSLLAPMSSLNYVFVAARVPFRCVVPECESAERPEYGNSTVAQLLPDDECQRFVPLRPDRHTCDRQHFHPNVTMDCDQFVYKEHHTIYAEFGLACREWRRTLVGTVRNAALPVALLLTGYISDGCGRRTALCVSAACAGTLGLVKSFAPDYATYVALEFFEAALGYGFSSAAYVMMVELGRPSLRAAFAGASGVAYGLGGALLAEGARRRPPWRRLLRAAHAPALALPGYWLLLDESVRWLHATGRTDRAVATLQKAARWNKVLIDENFIRQSLKYHDGEDPKPAGNPWLSLVSSRELLLRFAACCFCWVAAAFVSYGLTINSVELSGDKYTKFALNMAMEIVASFLVMMALERIGRRISISVAFLLCGLASVIPFFSVAAAGHRALHFLGKLSITFAVNALYVFTAELFPTRVRTSALAAASLVGRLGSVLAPQTPLLSRTTQAALYGALSLGAAGVTLLAPETRRAPLPQHARRAERLRGASRAPPAPAAAALSPALALAPAPRPRAAHAHAPPAPALTRIIA